MDEMGYPTFSEGWEFSDLIMVLKTKKYHVHKAVISMWSPLLKRKILELGEGCEELDIDGEGDLSTQDVLELLQTIYPPNKPISPENCERLVAIANKFNIFELLRRCEEFLIKNKTPTLELLVFAQTHKLNKLLSKCIEYCSKQSIEELKKSHYDKITPHNLCNLLEVRCLKMEKKLKRSEMRSWELTCTLRAIYESWSKKEGACIQHRRNGMHQENCNDCLHAIKRQIDKLCELALDNPSDQSD